MCYTQGKPVKDLGIGDIKTLLCKQTAHDKSVEKVDEASQTLKRANQIRKELTKIW